MYRINWKPSSHTIADLRDWDDNKLLGISPEYQRREVWTDAAKVMLIDTIIKNIPIPKIYISTTIKNGKSFRRVIDGQQRIRSILSFVRNEFSLKKPYDNDSFKNNKFSDLPEEIQDNILTYLIDFNEIYNTTVDIERDIYLRVNKYTKVLNKQELRRADYPGEFLSLSEQLSFVEFFKEANIFTYAQVRRMLDIEFISELLAIQLEGIADKKEGLEKSYEYYSDMDKKRSAELKEEFFKVIQEIEIIFNHDPVKLSKTRFKQKADLYTLFSAILELNRKGLFITNKDCSFLLADIQLLDKHIAPESEISLLSEYAIKCTSQANSNSSRVYRKNFMLHFLKGTYISEFPNEETIRTFKKIKYEIFKYIENRNISDNIDSYKISWSPNTTQYQLSNSILIDEKGNVV
ncbi:MAG TPA: DUF262 domain-containing protein [Leptospiraceae bacterium]|nr:DUF262 domain-containing protein [Leptospiraceae bacterium]